MKVRSLVCVLAMGALVGAVPAAAEYASIAHNLIDSNYDSTYIDGVLRVDGSSNLLTLNDDPPIAGVITNASVELETYFHHVEEVPPASGNVVAVFWGGSFDLTFDFDGTPHELSGPIQAMQFEFTEITSGLSRIDGEGLFSALVKDLPGSGIWPDDGGFSSIDTLTLAFDAGTDWSWEEDITEAETQYTLVPNGNAAPEPTTLALLVLGGLAAVRRR